MDKGEDSAFEGSLRVDFIKGSRDNPKINAILVIKGTINDVPPLAPIKSEHDQETVLYTNLIELIVTNLVMFQCMQSMIVTQSFTLFGVMIHSKIFWLVFFFTP